MTAIELTDIGKNFGSVRALNGVDLSVETGEIFGFLGTNGAGKSTTIGILLDFAVIFLGFTYVFEKFIGWQISSA